MKEPFSAKPQPQSSDDRRTFESVLNSARKKVTERNFNGAVDDCKLAMSILMARPASLAIQHSISECLECMADAYNGLAQHENALNKYEEAFHMRGKVFQRVEKPMMELLFKLERTLTAQIASGHIEKFNETENRWKAFVLTPKPGPRADLDDSIIPGQNSAELQQLWKRVVKKQKSEARMSKMINRFSMPSLVIPAIIVFVLAIAVPLCLSYIKTASDANTDKQNAVSDDTKTDTGTTTGSTASSTTGSSATSSSTQSSTGKGTSVASATVGNNASVSTGPQVHDITDWFDGVKQGTLADREFSTADKELLLKFSADKSVTLKNVTLPLAPTKCTYFADGGDFQNLVNLFEQTIFHKCYWLSVSRLGVMDAGGTNYFDTSLPEYATIQQMAKLALQGRDLSAMKRVGGDNVSYKSLPGKTADAIISTLKPELAQKKPFSIVCIAMPDTKKKTVFVIGLDRNKNLLPVGRFGKNYVLASDVDFSKQVLPDFENVVITDNPVQQARFRAVGLLSIIAAVLLLLCIFARARAVRYIGLLLMLAVVILTLVAFASSLQSMGLQKVK